MCDENALFGVLIKFREAIICVGTEKCKDLKRLQRFKVSLAEFAILNIIYYIIERKIEFCLSHDEHLITTNDSIVESFSCDYIYNGYPHINGTKKR